MTVAWGKMPVHEPVLREAVLEALSLSASDTVLDGTFGRGGHAMALLSQLGPHGRLIAIDRDPEAIAYGQQHCPDPRIHWFCERFSAVSALCLTVAPDGCEAMLFDFGVSSPQLDVPERGFSFQQAGPLDMRMSPEAEMTAADWLATASEAEMAQIFYQYGEEKHARYLARGIVARRAQQPFLTTADLSAWIAAHMPGKPSRIHPATRVFQAIRIHVNQELQEIADMLPQVLRCLKPGGRVAFIAFHSLEDRLVKQFLQAEAYPERAYPVGIPLRQEDFPKPTLKIMSSLIRPSEEEMARNPRARSARLRVAMRL